MKEGIILHCQSCHSVSFDLVDSNAVRFLPKVKFKV